CELRALPAARAPAPRAGEEARDGRARARRARAVGRGGRGSEPAVGGVTSGAGEVRPARVAGVIDVGSNSVLLLVVSVDAPGRLRILDEALATTRLGAGLRAGATLDVAARERTRDAVVAFAARARRTGATQ